MISLNERLIRFYELAINESIEEFFDDSSLLIAFNQIRLHVYYDDETDRFFVRPMRTNFVPSLERFRSAKYAKNSLYRLTIEKD